jgi:DNA topoisomerase III
VICKAKAGKILGAPIVRELIKKGRTEKPVTDEGLWRVEFDEPWAREGRSHRR